MSHEPKTFTITDPRLYDGDPFDVAQRACLQAAALARLLTQSLEGANVMARNAQMERELQAEDEPNAAGWPDTAQGRRFAKLIQLSKEFEQVLALLAKASSYNPKKPPKE